MINKIKTPFLKIIFFFAVLIISHRLAAIDIIRNIEENNTDSIAYFLDQGNDINGIYPRYTLLELAIRYHKIDIVRLLVDRGARVNQPNNQTTPLFVSIITGQQHNSIDIIEYLIENGADMNFKGLNGLTPFVLACKIGNSPAARLLFLKGADPSVPDILGNDFFYYVLRGDDPSLIRFFVSEGFEIPRMASLKDGPYISQQGEGTLDVHYMLYDSITDRAKWSQLDPQQEGIDPQLEEAISYRTQKNNTGTGYEFKKVENIFVVSDIHGQYDHFVELLKANRIIDRQLDWAWGNGHLVINGDVFDRGEKVTECLWLIYKLEYQAERSGGKLHFLLGNHELMVLKNNDKTYVHDRYILPYAKAGIDYSNLFNREYILGQWLQTKNVAVKINQFLFVHGGIPPYFVEQKVSLEMMNQWIHRYMADTSGIVLYADDQIIEPTWYRGYFEEPGQEETLKTICKFYKVDKIVVGHTPVTQIMPLQGGYVIGVGIHFGEPGKAAEGLLIRDEKLFRCDDMGNRMNL